MMTRQYKELEPDIRPEYLKKMKKIQKESIIRVGSADDFKKRYDLK